MEHYKASQYRKAADQVWELAKEYEDKGLHDLVSLMKELSVQLHDSARKFEESNE